MIVCIAEKPSVAKDIARIIGATKSHDGYMEGNGYQVTWTFGHLCELKTPDDYTDQWKRWSLAALPMIPQRFGIRLINDEGIKKQFAVIQRLMQAADGIINCGDAGQEGELIQRWVMQKAGAKCPVKRLWISSMTDEAIREGFQSLKDQSCYQSLYMAGLSRAIGDWILGMNAIVEGLAQDIVSGNVPDILLGKRLVSLDMSGLVAKSKYRGEFEERIKKVISEVSNAKNVLLFIDELHTIIGAGGAEGSLDASNILKPALARGEVQVIGATTIEEYRKYVEKDAALERRFQPVMVEEPGVDETIEILTGLKGLYEKHHGVIITDEGVKAAVNLSARYINDRFLPDKAIDLMDEAAARIRLKNLTSSDELLALKKEITDKQNRLENALSKGDLAAAGALMSEKEVLENKQQKLIRKNRRTGAKNQPVVGENEIADVVSGWTKIPVNKLTESEAGRLAKLEQILHKRVIGQEEAVSAVAKAVRRGRVGLKDPKKPIGSFLFLGPTGVGKTEVSKALAEAVFGKEDAMIRVDMSEYMEKHSVSKMIGSPPGYVGHEEGGQLSEKVRRNPFSVILFDEIEKAHPDVFNILLQVLDDGRITDSQGRTVDFKNTIIIMTSNAGASSIIEPKRLGFGAGEDEKQDHERMKNSVMEEVRRIFKPEFLNRIDETIVFRALNKDDMKHIVTLLVKELKKRCKEQLDIELTVRDSAKSFIVDKAYDRKYGARPLKRKLQEEIEDRMSEDIITGKIKRGNKVIISTKNKQISLTVE